MIRDSIGPDAWRFVSGRDPDDPGELHRHRLIECPVGGHFVWISVEWEPQELRDPTFEWVTEEAVAGSFDCRLCGLSLDGADLAWLGFPTVLDTRLVEREDS